MNWWQRNRALLFIFIPIAITWNVMVWGKDLSTGRWLLSLAIILLFMFFIAMPLAAWAEWDLQMRKKDSKYGPMDKERFIRDWLNSKEK
jgi:hypothetical protein